MSRHRNVRTRNFSDEYDGYDDVYGHSIEDDYCMSPSEAAFMYDREGSRNQQKIGAYLQSVKDIVEEDEMESSQSTLPLSDIDQAKLESCLEQLKSTFGSSVTQEDMVKAIISHNFNVEEATTFIFDNVNPNQQTKKEKDVDLLSLKSSKSFTIPKLNAFNPKKTIHFSKQSLTKIQPDNKYSSLSALVSNHLNNSPRNETPLSNYKSTDLKCHFQNQPKSKINFNKICENNDTNEMTEITRNLLDVTISKSIYEKIELNSSQSLNVMDKTSSGEQCIDGNWHIDLSKALRATCSAPIVVNHQTCSQIQVEKFVPPFIDCDIPVEKSQVYCNMDNSYVLAIKSNYIKNASKFGKIICKRYKKHYPYLSVSKKKCNKLTRFTFNTPSPDDIIKRSLQL